MTCGRGPSGYLETVRSSSVVRRLLLRSSGTPWALGIDRKRESPFVKLLTALDSLSRLLLSGALVVILGGVGWLGYSYYMVGRRAADVETQLGRREAEVKDLGRQLEARQRDIEAKQREIERLQTANRLLKVDRRLARIEVVAQTGSAADGDLATKFTFQEVDSENQPLEQPRAFTVQGDLIYVDAWVIKYEDRLVEAGDPLHAMSVCLFRRIFGEAQEPRHGFVLDQAGVTPAAYNSGRPMNDTEREIWSKFWEYANNPAMASQAGVRAAHGEAPSIKLMPGKCYRVSLRASAGLEIAAEASTGRNAG
jgi:hypothetical protein